jgi:hypothetical protein
MNKQKNFEKCIIALVALFALAGCNSVVYTYTDADNRPVTVKASSYGRGCIAFELDKNKNPQFIQSTDATTDWVVGRIVSPLINVAAMVLAKFPTGGKLDTPAPSAIGGCDSLFTDAPDEEDQPGGSPPALDDSGVWVINPPASPTEEP